MYKLLEMDMHGTVFFKLTPLYEVHKPIELGAESPLGCRNTRLEPAQIISRQSILFNLLANGLHKVENSDVKNSDQFLTELLL